ncbi:MAG: XRE family transcriptional regulator [Pseudomonadota bacterium]
MRSGIQRFVGSKLTEVRQARGITSRKALADILQCAPSTVQRWEEGDSFPEAQALNKISTVLSVPEDFFLNSRSENSNPSFFRSFAAALNSERLAQKARLRWLEDVTAVAEHYAFLPEVDIPNVLNGLNFKSLRDEDIEQISCELRNHWGLGLRPILNMVNFVEDIGIVVAAEQMGTSRLDGLSRWSHDGRPYMLLASDKQSFARRQFDAAHELGHIILHRQVTEIEFKNHFKLIEEQANRFASALLLPASQFVLEVNSNEIWELERLKVRWKVSIKAQIMRLKSLDLINQKNAQRLFKIYSSKGYSSNGEPYDDAWPLQKPNLLMDIFTALVDQNQLSKDALLHDMPLHSNDVESLAGLPTGWFEREVARTIEFKGVKRQSVESKQTNAEIIHLNRK